MDVGFGIFWRLKLNDKLDIWNVKASGSNISCYQDLKLVIFKPLERDLSLILSDVTMHHLKIVGDFSLSHHVIGISFGRREDNCSSRVSITSH